MLAYTKPLISESANVEDTMALPVIVPAVALVADKVTTTGPFAPGRPLCKWAEPAAAASPVKLPVTYTSRPILSNKTVTLAVAVEAFGTVSCDPSITALRK